MEKLLIRGGSVYRNHRFVPADVLCADGKILAVGEGLPADGAQVLDAAGLRVAPGFIILRDAGHDRVPRQRAHRHPRDDPPLPRRD